MTFSKELALLDSNILVYNHQAHSPYHKPCRDLITKALRGELFVSITPQVLTEFYAIITDPRRVTNPVSAEKAREEVEKYIKAKNILQIFSTEHTLVQLIELLKKYPVTQQEIFDLYLVATMLTSGVNRIYTYNEADFAKLEEIQILSL